MSTTRRRSTRPAVAVAAEDLTATGSLDGWTLLADGGVPAAPGEVALAIDSDGVQALTAQQREAVVLRHVLDLSVEQTVQVLGTSPGAVRALTHRAVTQLRDTVELADPVIEEANDVS